MGVCLSGRERVDDHVHGEGGDKGRQKNNNDKDNDTGWEQAAACGGGSTKWLDSYLAREGGLPNRKSKRRTNQHGKRQIQSILSIFRTT